MRIMQDYSERRLKDLPIEITDKYSDNDEVYISKFNWTFNQSGLPTELDVTNDGEYTDKIVFPVVI